MFAVGHCTASHCIGLYKEITLKWPKSPFALIYRDGMGGKRDAGRWSKSKTRIPGRKRFLCLSSWCSSSSCLQSALLLFLSLFSWLWLSLLLLLEHKHCTQQKVCANVCECHFACVVCIAANCCALLGCFMGSENEPNSMHWMLWKQITDLFMHFFFNIYVSFCFMFNKYCCWKKQVKGCVCVFLKHESASAVCVFGNSQRAETSMRSEWSFHTAPALFQDFVVPGPAQALALALARALVLLGTSHRLALPLWEEQSPCGSWDTERGIRSCHRPTGLCCPADRSLQGNLQEIEELDLEVLAGSAAPWRRCWTGRRWHGTSWKAGGGRSNLPLSLALHWGEQHRWQHLRVRWKWHRLVRCSGSGSETPPGSGWHGTGGAPHHGWWLGRCSSHWLDPVIRGENISPSVILFEPYIRSNIIVLTGKDPYTSGICFS